MENKFKNPFEIDEQNLEMISLQANPNAMQSISSQKVAFPTPTDPLAQSQPNTNLTVSQQSMFEVITPKIQSTHKEPSSLDENDDPPLLQDIGIDLQLIKKRVVAVLTFKSADEQLITTPDLSGPLLIAVSLGVLLLLGGKMHFSDIESAFVVGNVLLYFLLNCMNRSVETVALYSIMSFIGYSLLPMLFLAVGGLLHSLNGVGGVLFSCVFAGWSAFCCSGLLAIPLHLEGDKMLLAYPLFLFYLSFALLIIF